MMLTKPCAHCATPFTTKAATRKFCGVPCSVKARNRPNWHRYDERTCPHCRNPFSVISWSKKTFCSHRCAMQSKVGKATGRRIEDAHLRRPRVARMKINGRAIFLHRHLMEQKIGRQLEHAETVHHIDCDSFHNVIGNLYLFANEREHQLAHASIERLVAPLLCDGIIEFVDGRYRMKERP